MLEDVSPQTRRKIIVARANAMQGRLDETLDALDTLASDEAVTVRSSDLLATRLLRAELLYLEERNEESFQELEEIKGSLGDSPPSEVEMVVRWNSANVGASRLLAKSAEEPYSLADQQRLTGISLRDTTAVLDAMEAADGGKHYDTLPTLWVEYQRSFRQGCWPIWHWATRNLAKECLQVGYVLDAAILSVLSLDVKTAESVGKALVQIRNREIIKGVLIWATKNALLWRHFTTACALVSELGDAVQESELVTVFEWVVRGCERQPKDGFEQSRTVKAWECAAAIAPLLGQAEASRLCHLAMSNSMWTEFSLHRPKLREAIWPCIPLLPMEQVVLLVDNLAEQLNQPSKTEEDITTTINLLTYAVDRCDSDAKARVAAALFPSGKGLSWQLVVAAPKLLAGKALPVNWDKSLDIILNDLLNEVQHIKAGEEPVPVSSSMMQHCENLPDGGKRLIHIANHVHFQAAAKYREALPDEKWNAAVQAMLDGVANTFNLLTNRIQHVKLLGRAAEGLNEEQRKKIFAVLAPISRGRIKSGLDEMTEEVANHPLTRYRMFSGKPEDLQAVAIQTLARIEKIHPKSYGKKLNRIIADGLMSSNRAIRQNALWAWVEAPGRASIPGLLVLLATRDANVQVSSMAIEAFGMVNGHSLSMKEFNGLVDSCRIAASSNNTTLRTAAAYCLRQIRHNLPGIKLQKIADSLLCTLEEDVCFSVRRQAKMNAEIATSQI